MKKGVVVSLFLCLFFVMLSFSVGAAEESKESYLITQNEEGYCLYKYRDGEPVLLREGSIKEIMAEAKLPERIILGEIDVFEDIELPLGSYALSGKIKLFSEAKITVSEGTCVSFSELEAKMNEGSFIRIKGGAVEVSDSLIEGTDAGAFKLDYSVISSLTLKSGSILSSSITATVENLSGSLKLLGGRVENSSGAAVSSFSSMFLGNSPVISGIGRDIETSTAINLSHEGSFYSSENPLSVKCFKNFEKGSLYEVFYNSKSGAADNISIFSESGREYELEYFERSEHTSEQCFYGVYLPYSVKLFDGGNLLYEQKKLRGEKIDEILPTQKQGYSFVRWYKDEAFTTPFSFDEKVSSDIKLYGKYSLDPPVFGISSLNFIYDTRARGLRFDNISHPLSDSGFYTYEWYKDGEKTGEGDSVSIKNVSDSGNYSCILTFNYLADSVSVKVDGISVTVERASLQPPVIPSAVYSGLELSPGIGESALYSFSDEKFINSGTYKIKVTLIDSENYRWADTDSEYTFSDFVINKAQNKFLTELSASDSYFGCELEINSKPLFGNSVYLFSKTVDGVYNTVLPTDAGSYYVKAVVEGTGNYTSLSSEPICFFILEERAVSVKVETDAEKTSYKSFESFNPTGLSLTVLYNSERSETVGLDKITFSYQKGDAFLFGDTGVVISHGGLSLVYPVEVIKSEYDLSSVDFSDIEIEYDGKFHTFEEKSVNITGKDGISLGCTVLGGGSEHGAYTLEIVFYTDSKEYLTPEPITLSLNIGRRSVCLVWENTVFVYDGSLKLPSAYYLDVFGVKRFPELNGAAINAGSTYLASAPDSGGNYIFVNPECTYGILKADYDFSKVSFTADSFVYDGEEKLVTVSGLPAGVNAIGYTDNRYTDSGNYRLTVALSYDAENYNPPPKLSHEWRILPAEYDMTDVGFGDFKAVFDGQAHYPIPSGALPVGFDGSSPYYVFSSGVTHVNEGRVPIVISFYSSSKNYNAPESITVYGEIIPLGINVTWSYEEYTYNGKKQAPTAFASECTVSVTGGAVDSGSYTATALSDNSDYYILNDTLEYVINKADNYFTLIPSVGDIFEGKTPSPLAEVYFGEIEVYYFTDPECTEAVESPDSVGIYYCIIEVEESRNYKKLSSSPMKFEVIEVVPVGINAALNRTDLKAFEILSSGDLTVTVNYNDGSEKTAQELLVRLEYQNGDSLRKKDTSVLVIYGEYELILPVSVDYGEYDLSEVIWKDCEAVYDGENKAPLLSGLPDGVTVSEYVGAGKNAGSYTVSAVLNYDRENYREPKIAPCDFVIKKQTVLPQKFESVIYNGKEIILESTSSLYTLKVDSELKNAGKYAVILSLIDKNNYAFSKSTEGEIRVDFEILPIKLTLTVSDYDLYLFSEVEKIDYEIIGGEILSGESIEVLQRVEGERIILTSKNPNYVLECNTAYINRIDRLSPDTVEYIIIFLFICVILILLGLMLLFNRERIQAYYLYLKEKRRRKRARYEPLVLSAREEPLAICEPEEKKEEPSDTEEAENDEREEKNKDGIDLLEDAMSVDVSHADELISDSLAKELLKRSREAVYTSGYKKEIINVDVLSRSFSSGERVDVNVLKKKGLLDDETAYIKVLARGDINKPLSVYANDFSLSAIKMIALTGGEAVKVITVKTGEKKNTAPRD